MAQAGYTPISLYYSTTSTQEPTAGNLVSGELAINIADGKLFYKNSAGDVRLLSIGYGSSSVTPTNGGVQYGTGTALALTAAGSSGQILRSNGAAAPTWADLSTLGVNTISFGTTGLTPNSATAGAVTVAGTLVTANGGTGLGGATPFTANGVLYASSASALTSGSALTFDGTNFSTTGTATATKLVPTGNVTAGNGMYLPATNTLAWSNNGAETMRLDSSGNLGLGVTPSAWASVSKAFQIGATGVIRGRSDANLIDVMSNVYTDTGGANKYIATDYATYYRQYQGQHQWLNAPSGTAGNAITFTQAMTLDASGRLGIGTTSPTQLLDIRGNTGSNIGQLIKNDGAGRAILELDAGGTSSAYLQFKNQGTQTARVEVDNSSNLSFSTGSSNTERARITSGGDLLVGTTSSPAYGSKLRVQGGIESYATQFNVVSGTSTQFELVNRSASSGFDFYVNSGGTLAVRITSGGYFKASDNGTYNGGLASQTNEINQSIDNNAVVIYGTNATLSTSGMVFLQAARNTTNNTFYALSYYNSGAAAYKFRVADSGDVTNTNGTYGTISDAKMKTDIVDAGSQWADIKAIRFRKFKMKDDPSGLLQLGVVAQELEQTSPGLVDEHTDRDADGNDLGTTTKSVKTSILLMKAAKALQEAMARIETLEAKVSALEGN